MKTRIAPTPSGLLHAGNAWSFLLAWLLARKSGGSVHLRIDDLDAARLRDGYLEDIFASLRWLGLDWDTGPRGLADVPAHSQHARMAAYRVALEKLAGLRDGDGALLYACACSRETVKRKARAAGLPGIYPGTCRDAGLEWRAGFMDPQAAGKAYPLRVRVPRDAQVTVGGLSGADETLYPGRAMGDFVVWQRNGEPAYQLASLVDDEAFGIDCIVRGADLLPSTGVQLWLAEKLGYAGFLRAKFQHHGLLLDESGGKLSKSEGAVSLQSLRERAVGPGPLLAFFAKALGMRLETVATASDLLPHFDPGRIPSGNLAFADLRRETGLA